MSEKLDSSRQDLGNCLVCGEPLVPLDKKIQVECAFCKKVEETAVVCFDNHYVCETCSHSDAKQIVKTICLNSTETDPVAIARKIMMSPAIRMHGPEHHFITPAVLLTAVANYENKRDGLEKKIELAEKLASERHPACLWEIGSCGALLGTSIFFAIWQSESPEKLKEFNGRDIVMRGLHRIAVIGNPRCCKRDTYIALEEAVAYLNKHYGIELPISEGKCVFSLRNQTCKYEECIYFNLKFDLV